MNFAWPDIFSPSYYTVSGEISIVIIQAGILAFFIAGSVAVLSFRTALQKKMSLLFWLCALSFFFALWNMFYIASYAQRDLTLPLRTLRVEFLDRAHILVGVFLPWLMHRLLCLLFQQKKLIPYLTLWTTVNILVLWFMPFGDYYKLFSALYGFFIFSVFLLLSFELWKIYKTTEDLKLKTRSFFVFNGLWSCTLLSVLGQIRAENILAGFPIPYIGNIVTAVFLYFLYQMALTPRLREVRELMLRGIRVIILTIILSIIFLTLLAWVGSENHELFIFNTFIASFIILSILEPLRQKMDVFFLKRFIVDRYEFEKLLLQLPRKLRAALNADELLTTLLTDIRESGRIYQTGIFLWDPHTREYLLARQSNFPFLTTLSVIHPLITYFKKNREPLLLEHEQEVSLEISNTLKELHAHIVLPIYKKEELIGLWALRSSLKSTNPYTSFSNTEIQGLEHVAQELMTALQQLSHFENQERQERLVALGELSAALAHEIRNPLSALQGATHLLETSPTLQNEDDKECLKILKKELERMQKTVDQYLNFARTTPERVEISVENLISKVAQQVSSKAAKTKTHIHVQVENNIPLLYLDPLKLEQVLYNLVQNACEVFCKNIFIQATHSSALALSLEISVKDDGPGISKEILPNIFVPLFTTKKAGSGLGLPICKKIIDSLGGQISVDTSSHGTEFKILLPQETTLKTKLKE